MMSIACGALNLGLVLFLLPFGLPSIRGLAASPRSLRMMRPVFNIVIVAETANTSYCLKFFELFDSGFWKSVMASSIVTWIISDLAMFDVWLPCGKPAYAFIYGAKHVFWQNIFILLVPYYLLTHSSAIINIDPQSFSHRLHLQYRYMTKIILLLLAQTYQLQMMHT